jgi:hypothetical protein
VGHYVEKEFSKEIPLSFYPSFSFFSVVLFVVLFLSFFLQMNLTRCMALSGGVGIELKRRRLKKNKSRNVISGKWTFVAIQKLMNSNISSRNFQIE